MYAYLHPQDSLHTDDSVVLQKAVRKLKRDGSHDAAVEVLATQESTAAFLLRNMTLLCAKGNIGGGSMQLSE